MDYKIISFDSSIGSIIVSFYDAELNQEFKYNIDIPVLEGKYINNEDLEEYIKSFEPKAQVQRLKEIKNNALDIPEKLKQVSPEVIIDPLLEVSLEEAKTFAIDHIEAQIGIVRSKYISTAFGQENTYKLKLEEAKNTLQGVPFVSYYLEEEALLFNTSKESLAEIIIKKDKEWNTEINPKLESLRVFTKSKIRQAESNKEVDEVLKSYITALLKY